MTAEPLMRQIETILYAHATGKLRPKQSHAALAKIGVKAKLGGNPMKVQVLFPNAKYWQFVNL